MSVLISESFRVGEREYHVSMSEDELLSLQDQVYEVRAFCLGPDGERQASIIVKISLNVEQRTIKISANGGEPVTVGIGELPEIEAEDSGDGPLDANEPDDSVLIEELLDAFPSDLLTCLAKGAATTLLGQIVRCWRQTPNLDSILETVSVIKACIAQHSWQMARKFIFKASRCVWRLGM